jgi:hypothetical protein
MTWVTGVFETFLGLSSCKGGIVYIRQFKNICKDAELIKKSMSSQRSILPPSKSLALGQAHYATGFLTAVTRL